MWNVAAYVDFKVNLRRNLPKTLSKSEKPMEASILNIQLTSGEFLKRQWNPFCIANCTDLFINIFFNRRIDKNVKTKTLKWIAVTLFMHTKLHELELCDIT